MILKPLAATMLAFTLLAAPALAQSTGDSDYGTGSAHSYNSGNSAKSDSGMNSDSGTNDDAGMRHQTRRNDSTDSDAGTGNDATSDTDHGSHRHHRNSSTDNDADSDSMMDSGTHKHSTKTGNDAGYAPSQWHGNAAKLFHTPTLAHEHCPNDTIVWLNTRSGVWHTSDDPSYGKTHRGGYVCEEEARAAGDHGAHSH